MKKILMAIAVMSLCFQACKKETPITKGKQLSGIYKSESVPSATPPTLENGIPTFTTRAQFDDYWDYLEGVVAYYDSTGTDTLHPDERLDLIENQIGYVSCRHQAKANFDALADVGFDDIDAIPEEHFIHSRALRSILNAQNEMKIEGTIFHAINKDYMIVLPVTDKQEELLNVVRTIDPSASNDDIIRGIPYSNDEFQVYSLDKPLNYDWADVLAKRTGDTYKIVYDKVFPVNKCGDPKDYELQAMRLNVAGAWDVIKAQFKINWGDGSPIQTEESKNPNNQQWNWYCDNLIHKFTTVGPHTIHIEARKYTLNNLVLQTPVVSTIDIVVNVGADCSYGTENDYEGDFLVDGNAQYKLKGFVWMDFYWSFGDKTAVGARTEAWRKDGNKWKKWTPAALKTGFTCDKYSSVCGFANSVGKSSFQSGVNKVEVEDKASNKTGWYEVPTEHSIYVENIYEPAKREYHNLMNTCN